MQLKSQFMLLSASFIIFLSGCSTLTPLSKAAKIGDVKSIRTLLSQGENINHMDEGRYYAQPLHWAARHGHYEAAKLLIESGADINGRDSIEQTPLIITAYAGNPGSEAIAKLLISKGADIDAIDYQGWKFIHYAKQAQNSVLIRLVAANKEDEIEPQVHEPDKLTINLDTVIPKIDYQGQKKIKISVIDKRKYVISGDNKPNYIGYIRQNYYRPPEELTTSNGKALSEILSTCISESYNKAGFEVLNTKEKAENTLILYINEWMSDAFYNVGFKYNFVLRVLDGNDILIDATSMSGTDDLGSVQGIPIVRSKLLVPVAAKKRLTELLNDSKVKRALQ
jgi:hypothetical protein